MEKIRVALIGFGLSGRYLQAPFFTNHPDFLLKKVFTNNQEPEKIFPQVKKVTELSEILHDPDIDLVSICTPGATHFELALQVLRAGKHLLVEKPFTPTVKEANTLIDLAKSLNKYLFVFQNRRFDSDFLTVRKIIEHGWLGDLLRFEAHYDRFKPVLNTKKWKETPAPANGILYDLGAHIIDQSIALFGKPLAVWGESYTQRAGSAIEDAFDIRLDYGRLKVHLSSSLMVREPLPRYVLHGTKGSFVKYGIDVQEDHLKAGLLPDMPGFGVESAEFQGILNTETAGLSFRGKVETLPGEWKNLFQNIADVLLRGTDPVVALEDIVTQIGIIEQVSAG